MDVYSWNTLTPHPVMIPMSDKVLHFPGCKPPEGEVAPADPPPLNTYLNEKGKQVFNLWEDRDRLSVLISHNPTTDHIDYDLLSNQPIHAMYMIGMLEHLIGRLKGRL